MVRRATSYLEGVDINLLEAKTIFLLSLWKTYAGPALGVGFGMSYIEAVGYTMLGATVAVLVTLYFERYVTQLFKWCVNLIPGRESDSTPKFNPGLRKAIRYYKRFGFWGLMALTPVLIGLPLGVWIAVRMGTSKRAAGVTTLLVALFWSTTSYIVTLNGLDRLPT